LVAVESPEAAEAFKPDVEHVFPADESLE